MIEFKYDDEKYIHNKNRDAIKKWLLNPPPKHHEMLLDMAGFEPYDNYFLFGDAFDQCYYDDEESMWVDCFNDLHIEDDDANICTFQYLLYALAKLLTNTKRLKNYKVHLKKLDAKSDFNA